MIHTHTSSDEFQSICVVENQFDHSLLPFLLNYVCFELNWTELKSFGRFSPLISRNIFFSSFTLLVEHWASNSLEIWPQTQLNVIQK